ncbi:MAG: phosphate signaling complex protein PhoU [Deltaproteobacteria bacterium]|jgi:phosphate transport system protein|nr:phosphate signaling complex protein PhoU [Deltaproteobacteria bacterium]
MTTGTFVEELESLRRNLEAMGHDVLAMVQAGVEALLARDEVRAQAVIKQDAEINAQENRAVDKAIRLIATNQPVAGDLRFLAASLRLATELERIGDLGSNLARRTLGLIKLDRDGSVQGQMPPELGRMGHEAAAMLEKALSAFEKRDPVLAEEVLKLDDIIDDYNRRIKKMILALIYDNGHLAAWGLEIINTSVHLERLGDHATNLAEEVIYVSRGQNIRHNY